MVIVLLTCTTNVDPAKKIKLGIDLSVNNIQFHQKIFSYLASYATTYKAQSEFGTNLSIEYGFAKMFFIPTELSTKIETTNLK